MINYLEAELKETNTRIDELKGEVVKVDEKVDVESLKQETGIKRTGETIDRLVERITKIEIARKKEK